MKDRAESFRRRATAQKENRQPESVSLDKHQRRIAGQNVAIQHGFESINIFRHQPTVLGKLARQFGVLVAKLAIQRMKS